MIGASFHTKGALDSLDRIVDGLETAVREGLEATAETGLVEARRRAGSGPLGRSIEIVPTSDGFDLAAAARHAGWVERGRGPVRAQKGGALAFSVGGRVLFRRSVGPARPRPFMRPAAVVMNRTNFVEKSLDDLIGGA